jgi:dipeptidyl aminopeptidase/acylaminoacyl peptidase
MNKDIRETALYQEAEALYKRLRQPGTGQISDAAGCHVSPDGRCAVFAGTIMESLEGVQPSRICEIDLASGKTQVLSFGPETDHLPKYSPDGTRIAFLSDRHKTGDFQLYLLDRARGAAEAAPRVDGWVEYLHWSPDGKRILLGVAGHGADISGGQGAVTSKQTTEPLPSWMPTVETGDETFRWRRAWIYDLATRSVRVISDAQTNVWEAVWCGDGFMAAVISSGPGEGLWYSAYLALIDAETGKNREIFRPRDQLGWPAGSPSGQHVAVVEAVCSDRWLVAGDVQLIETRSGRVQRLDTHGVDVACTEWRSDRVLMLAGHRDFETVLALYDVETEELSEVWSSSEVTTGGFYVTVSGYGASGDCVLVGESFTRAPEIGVIRAGQYRTVKSFDLGYVQEAKVIRGVEPIRWTAPDGLEIHGWLLLPHGQKPHPLVACIHGGPVWQWRPFWLGRARAPNVLMLLKRGYAIFFPNPRGSTGRGQEFARRVQGDMGGAETTDHLSGLTYLVDEGIADPDRLGVTGGSHGGFMTSWLITQDPRFAAAVPMAPITNQVSGHLIGNIPHFVKLFLADDYTNPTGRYFQRSPIMHAHKAKTPTLNICGLLDRCTPPEEAVQFHNALLENGVKSVLVTYPEEGHGIRKLPAMLDYMARLVGWFEEHMGSRA